MFIRKERTNLLYLSIIIILAICTGAGVLRITGEQTTEEVKKIDAIKAEVERMSLDRKIGQLLIVGFESPHLDQHIKQMIQDYHIGGVNLLGRNIQDENQTKKLIIDLQNFNDQFSNTPLFIAADQEGGAYSRFKFLNELTPQIEIKDTKEAREVSFERGRELKELGVNMVFSPVLDYASDKNSYIYNRTFGVAPEKIAELGGVMVSGYQETGIVPVAKHFPGYGNVYPDPHTNEAVLGLNREELNLNLQSFKNLLTNNLIGAVMTSHIIVLLIDEKPATLSSKFLSGLLREEWGFRGVIFTDDIGMKSVKENIRQAAVEAVKAGADVIIVSGYPTGQIGAFNALKEAVLNNEISVQRINESVARILKLKYSNKNGDMVK